MERKIKQIIPAQQEFYATFREADGIYYVPVIALALIDGPVVDSISPVCYDSDGIYIAEAMSNYIGLSDEDER